MSESGMIYDHVAAIRARLESLAPPGQVKLMAVTKFHSRSEAMAAVEAGVDLVGENRIQEAVEKWQGAAPGVPLHAIGHLQTNKVKYAIGLFDAVDAVDSDRLAAALDRTADKPVRIMVEVNVGGEASKFGLAPGAVFPFIQSLERYPRLVAAGLMTVLPERRENSVEETRRIRGHMQEMVGLWRMCRSEGWPWAPLNDLSMGMSGDWEWAVEAGSTIIRLGTRIFGQRPKALRD
jgi:hypothetical protein